jgi:preprotein translocase subunit SecG
MATFVLTLHVVLCVLLVFIILLQPGKGGDVSAAFGGGSSTQLFGAAGPGNFLTRGTGVIAVLFVVTSVALAKMGGGVGKGPELDADEVNDQLFNAPAAPAAGAPAPAAPAPASGTTAPAAPTPPSPTAPAP